MAGARPPSAARLDADKSTDRFADQFGLAHSELGDFQRLPIQSKASSMVTVVRMEKISRLYMRVGDLLHQRGTGPLRSRVGSDGDRQVSAGAWR